MRHVEQRSNSEALDTAVVYKARMRRDVGPSLPEFWCPREGLRSTQMRR